MATDLSVQIQTNAWQRIMNAAEKSGDKQTADNARQTLYALDIHDGKLDDPKLAEIQDTPPAYDAADMDKPPAYDAANEDLPASNNAGSNKPDSNSAGSNKPASNNSAGGKPDSSNAVSSPPASTGNNSSGQVKNDATSSAETDDADKDAKNKKTPLLDTLGNQFGIKDMLKEKFGNDEAKMEKWLKDQNYSGHADGLTKDANGNEAIQYDTEFAKLFRALVGDKWEKAANWVSGPGKAGTNSPIPDVPNDASKYLKTYDPELFAKVNEKFTIDGRLYPNDRNRYLESLVGNGDLTPRDMRILKERFVDAEHLPLIYSKDVFMDLVKDKDYMKENPEKTKYVSEMLETYPCDPYVLDQLASRFSGSDGKLNNNEVRALNDYIKGHIWTDSNTVVGQHKGEKDWERLGGEGARPKKEAVDELIADPTVLSRMPNGGAVFSGDNIGGLAGDPWMKDRGGYTEKDDGGS